MTARSDIDVDFVVREVVRRLRQAAENGAVERPRKDPPTPLGLRNNELPRGSQAVKSNKVVLPQRVVTLDALPEDWDGVSCIQVPRGAVVTPSVRDELRQRGVVLHFTEAATPAATVLGLGIDGDPGYGQAAIDQQQTCDALAASLDVHVHPYKCGALPEVVADLTHCIRQERLAVLLTERPHLAVCMLNRRAEVRAICVDRPEAVEQAVDETAANVMVIERGTLHVDRLVQLVRPFARMGWQPCPDHTRRSIG
jgi:hypothetical protein